MRDIALFPELVGQRPIPAAHVPEWPRFFAFEGAPAPQASKRIDATYTAGLMHLPRQLTGELAQPEHVALAYRDLQRGAALGLPSGEAVAKQLGVEAFSRAELGLPSDVCAEGPPLSYYLQREAAVQRDGMELERLAGVLWPGCCWGCSSATRRPTFRLRQTGNPRCQAPVPVLGWPTC